MVMVGTVRVVILRSKWEERPSVREIVFRLIAAWRGGPALYRDECAKVNSYYALTPTELGSLLNDFVHVAGFALPLASEASEISSDEFEVRIEKVLDEAGTAAGSAVMRRLPAQHPSSRLDGAPFQLAHGVISRTHRPLLGGASSTTGRQASS